MSDRVIEGNFQTFVVDDEQQARELNALSEQLSERFQGSSPTRRMAAYHSDVDLVGRSQAYLEVLKQVDCVSKTDSPVLLIGESGPGTELVAAAIHQRSGRADKPFVAVRCRADHDGREQWEEAEGGTLFLDQISETTASFQEKLLRALQTNVRVIAATDRNLDHEVTAGRFSNDLFHCLNALTIALPPLREHLPANVRDYSQTGAENGNSTDTAREEWVTLSTIEGRYVAQVLEHTRGNKQAAARVLAVDRKTLDRMIKRHHIDSEKVRRAYR